MTDPGTPLRIGILGAARIAPNAIIHPARHHPAVTAIAVAARDATKAQTFAHHYQVPRVHTSYAALIDDPDVDAIYNPLPNNLHAVWTIRALEAGKHVLCEKPFAANSDEAVAMAATAERTDMVLMEAFHYRYHPLILRALEILHSGEIGTIRHIETAMCVPNLRWWDIRWRYDLAGGALMDVGCYAIHLLRTLAGAEPTVRNVSVRLRTPQVDRAVKADFTFANGISGHIHCSMWSSTLLKLGAKVVGDRGVLTIRNPFVPQLYNRLTVHSATGVRHEEAPRTPTYHYQLDAFVEAIHTRGPFPTDPLDAIANMRVIDAIYDAAGLPRRGM